MAQTLSGHCILKSLPIELIQTRGLPPTRTNQDELLPDLCESALFLVEDVRNMSALYRKAQVRSGDGEPKTGVPAGRENWTGFPHTEPK